MQVDLGSIFEGKVTGITKFGVFVDFGENKTGMVHISEVASTFVKEIKDFVSVGQTVKVKVISVSEQGKIALSMKQAEPAPTKEFKHERPNKPVKKRYSSRPAPEQGPARPGDYEWHAKSNGGNFEDMLSQFKQTSDEKISDLKRSTDTKRSGGFSRKDNR